ncbi:hypothetical protein E1265_21420 [Streptomyces sp. 8K308]|uniref:hypothetical protein n=1 Tax=Streptomyces sp. 8K308 TaxID=2530388 RepID=UPI00104DF098|nr:hypothetical protein [Streptomyces sp. 8K308]TDC20588.1 hypothetical protein E1265_21420 [Streptomyces sp. 8K308]
MVWVLRPAHGVLATPRGGNGRAANRWFRRLCVTPRIAAEADGHEALLALVALDYGTGVIPDLVYATAASGTDSTKCPHRPAPTS